MIVIHKLSFTLPKFENVEEGQQIRRSIKSVKSNIVEGFGRRQYKMEFIKFLVYAHSSNDETIDHLENLYETNSLTDKEAYDSVKNILDLLGRKISKFISSVEQGHISKK